MKKPAKIEELNKNLSTAKADRPIPGNEIATQDKSVALYQFHMEGLRDTAEASSAFIMHLYQMKSKELWRKSGHHSYKDFCEKEVIPLMKVPVSLTRLYQLAEFEEVLKELPPKVSTKVETETQARALAKAPKEERAAVVEAVAAEGKVTAKAITAKIEEKKKEKPEEAEFEALDAMEYPVPKNLQLEWNRSLELEAQLVKPLREVKKLMKAGIGNDKAFVRIDNAHLTQMDNMIRAVQIGPYVVCRSCSGKKCKDCKQQGFHPKAVFDRLPKEVKEKYERK